MTRLAWNWIGWCGVAAALAVAFDACSSSPGQSGGRGGASVTGSGGGQLVDTSRGSATVTQAGVTLVIPQGALAVPTTITITPVTFPTGNYTPASGAYRFEPAGTMFAQPVTIKIPLTAAEPGAHLFWSNAASKYEDLGGTVSGTTVTGFSLTGYISHFSTGFCAVAPEIIGTGGSIGTAGTSGTAGSSGGSTGVAGNSGGGSGGATTGSGGGAGNAAGRGGSGVGGGGGVGGNGNPGSGGSATGGQAGAGGNPDAGNLCATMTLNLPTATVTNAEAGTAPDPSTYTGGTIVSGRYYLNAVTHYGAGTFTGAKQAQYLIDAAGQTIQIGERSTTATYYIGMTYTPVDPHTLGATVQCNTSPDNLTTMYLYFTVTGSQLKLTTAGSSDVLTLQLSAAL